MSKVLCLIGAAFLFADIASAAAGDAYVYRVVNGYNNELRGTVQYRVEKAEADRVEVAVTTDTPSAGSARTEIYSGNGNWLRHPLASHDRLLDFEFSAALPVYIPGDRADNSWSTRVNAVDPATGRRNSVRVDGRVIGNERITVAAGTFDTVKIQRRTYVGDWDGFLRETQIVETDWYAPSLSRPVRSDSKSTWQDNSRCTRGGCPWFRGDWNVTELAEIATAKTDVSQKQ
jgi:hypothetical protein